MKNLKTFFFLLLFVILTTSGCSKLKPAAGITLDEAHQKFEKLCLEDLKVSPVLVPLKNTLWIYIPLKINIVDVKGTKEGPLKSNEAQTTLTVNYLDVVFSGRIFNIEYDISNNKTYKKDFGYSSAYSEEYQKIQKELFVFIQKTYFEVDDKTASIEPPKFIALVTSDIVRGIEIEMIINFEDLKRYSSFTQSLPQDEFSKRYVTELKGSESIINDTEGKHINFKDISFEEFLAKQIAARINFKYQRSSFAPSEDTKYEILNQCYDAVNAYGFEGFDSIKLNDLSNGSLFIIPKGGLSDYSTPALPAGGKIHVIKFN